MRDLRRMDRKLSEEDALTVLRDCEYGFLCTVNEDGSPYAVPMCAAMYSVRINGCMMTCPDSTTCAPNGEPARKHRGLESSSATNHALTTRFASPRCA